MLWLRIIRYLSEPFLPARIANALHDDVGLLSAVGVGVRSEKLDQSSQEIYSACN